jgi:hypothetical protein
MYLFCFASKNVENIKRGIAAKMWAVSKKSGPTMRGRATKARRYFTPGVRGLLYCRETHSFTVPFLATSKRDRAQGVGPRPCTAARRIARRAPGKLGASPGSQRILMHGKNLRRG